MPTNINYDTLSKLSPKLSPYMIFDDQIPGFAVKVHPNGSIHYVFQFRKEGKIKRVVLGNTHTTTPEQARYAAKSLRESKSNLIQPDTFKTPKFKMTEAFDRFLTEHALVYCKPRTVEAYKWIIRKYLEPYFGHLFINEVGRGNIGHFHLSMKQTPYNANRALEVLGKIFELAEMWELRPDGSNPTRFIKKYPMKPRQRYLSKPEAARLCTILDQTLSDPTGNHAAAYCIKLLLFTGCRLSEIQTLKWSYINLGQNSITLPDSKTGPKTVYFSQYVRSLLDDIKINPYHQTKNPYVIWGQKPGCHLVDIQGAWQRFRKSAGIEDVRIHDLRHTYASFAINDGISLEVISKLLGHKQIQTTSRYAHLYDKTLLSAVEQVSKTLM